MERSVYAGNDGRTPYRQRSPGTDGKKIIKNTCHGNSCFNQLFLWQVFFLHYKNGCQSINSRMISRMISSSSGLSILLKWLPVAAVWRILAAICSTISSRSTGSVFTQAAGVYLRAAGGSSFVVFAWKR